MVWYALALRSRRAVSHCSAATLQALSLRFNQPGDVTGHPKSGASWSKKLYGWFRLCRHGLAHMHAAQVWFRGGGMYGVSSAATHCWHGKVGGTCKGVHWLPRLPCRFLLSGNACCCNNWLKATDAVIFGASRCYCLCASGATSCDARHVVVLAAAVRHGQ